LPTLASASEITNIGRVTSLEVSEEAPYSGILLDAEATAKILADKRFLSLQFDLKLDLDVKRLTSKHQLELGLLQARYDGLNNQHTQILKIKSDEIVRLQEIVKDRPNSNSEWWLAGGVVTGILVSIGVFYAAAEGFSE
tara:strand:+ start:912 stop:1328 length:417 start_codon:yes stop_codon:yes gene_type:complete